MDSYVLLVHVTMETICLEIITDNKVYKLITSRYCIVKDRKVSQAAYWLH